MTANSHIAGINGDPHTKRTLPTRVSALLALALTAIAGCAEDVVIGGDDPSETRPAALEDESDIEIDAITSASMCTVPPVRITASMGPPGWTYVTQEWRRADGATGCTNPGQLVPYCPGSGGSCLSAFRIVSNRTFSSCSGATDYGIWCDGEWIACPHPVTLTDGNFVLGSNGSTYTSWSPWWSYWHLNGQYSFPYHQPTTTYAANGTHVRCNYTPNYGYFYLTY